MAYSRKTASIELDSICNLLLGYSLEAWPNSPLLGTVGSVTVILLPLRPASVTHKNFQRGPNVHGKCPAGCKAQSIDQSENVFVEYIHVISVAVLVAVV